MSLLAAPLEQSQIEEIRARHPHFKGTVPTQAKFWTEADLDQYFSSGGTVWPQVEARGSPTGPRGPCALLTRLRQNLAEQQVNEATAEYRSLCRHLRERAEDPTRLPGVASCTEVLRVKKASSLLKSPVVVERARMWPGRRWNAAFWRRHHGSLLWKCRTRAPFFDGDASSAGMLAELCTAGEYVDYMFAIQAQDPECEEGNGVAFPRASFNDWPVFVQGARDLLLEKSFWRKLAPAGVRDFSLRWLKCWSAACEDMPHLDQLARLHRISLGAPGCTTRLHVEAYQAHAWFTQIEGSRLFFIFPPQSAKQLYEQSGKSIDPETVHDHATKISPVDLFFPSQKRHTLFKEAQAQFAVLTPGLSLVLPCGWWYASVVLEPSVTLHRIFWNAVNRGGIVDCLRDIVTCEREATDNNARAFQCLEELYESIMDDADPDDSDE